MIFWISSGILVFALIIQLINYFFWKKNLGKFSRLLFFAVIAAVVIYYVYLTYSQYLLWRDSSGIAKYFVPPHRSIIYVIGYHFIRFAMYYMISLLIALIFLFAAKHYNKKFQNRFFEQEEPYLGALVILVLGNREWHYAWILYLILLLVFSALGSAIFCNWLKKMERFPLCWLWLPTAVFAILIGRWLPVIISNF